jgi:hypothetical protein
LETHKSKVALTGMPFHTSYQITDTALGYHEKGFGEEQEYVFPVYLIFADFFVDGQLESSDVVFVPAAEMFLNPIAKIITPADESVVQLGSQIKLRGSASHGTSPYSYLWTSEADGFLGTGNMILVSDLSHGNHTINLKVIDSAGKTGEAMDTLQVGALLQEGTDAISVQGGSVNFTLKAGEDNAFRDYLVLGGISGTSPGTPLPGGAVFPLNFDVFTEVVLAYLNTPIFSNFLGIMDANGEAAAQLNAPPVDPNLTGLVMYYAYACNGPFELVSKPVEITFID